MDLTPEEFENTYQIHRIDLGFGAFGTVKKATKKYDDGKEYAVKLMEWESSGRVSKHCKREIESVLMLRHKNIVQFFGFCPCLRWDNIENGQY